MGTNAIAVLAEVADRINNSTDEVRGRLVHSLVEKEVSSRVGLLDQALLKLKDADKELKKLGPDMPCYSETGEVVSNNYSKARFEERKKAVETRDKLEKAIEEALTGDFKRLKEAK